MRAPGFWYRPPGLAAGLLAPAGWLYGAAGWLRFALARPVHPGVPVICIGNLVAGGAGKTPVALALTTMMRERGLAVHCVTRGYGGRERGPLRVDPSRHDVLDVGDKSLLLAALAPTWVARKRAVGAEVAVAAGAGVLILDDGFQNPALKPDLSLLVVDGAAGFGNGRLIPAGPLREPVLRGLARASAVVVMGEDQAGVAAEVATWAAARGRHLPVIHARLIPDPAVVERLRGRRVLAFAGIGRPEKFFRTCTEAGLRLTETIGFADHHIYRPDEIKTILERAAIREAVALTTVKDAVRLPSGLRWVQVLPVTLAWRNRSALDRLIEATVNRHG